MDDSLDIELLYVADPMCSWCWGFSPIIDRIAANTAIPVRVVVGGLRPGDQAEPIERIRGYLERAWAKVSAASGQPFDTAILDRKGWCYDTMTADKAIVAMRSGAPGHTLAFLSRVQRAFYVEGVDVTDPATYGELVEGFPVDPDGFVKSLSSEAIEQDTHADFQRAAWMGVSGFPTLLLRDGPSAVPLSLGYAPYEAVADRLNALIERNHPDAIEGLSCDLESGTC